MTAPVNPSNETNEVHGTTPAPPPRSPHRTFPFSVPTSSLFPSLPLSVLVLFLCLLASAENPKVYFGQTITNVAVTLTGPEERLLVLAGDTDPLCCKYTANGSYEAVGEIEDETIEVPVVETYTWDVDEEVVEIVAGGGPTDNSITIRFRADKEADTSVSVTYTVSPPGGAAAAGLEVMVPFWDKDGSGEEPNCTMTCDGGIVSPADGTRVLAGAEIPLQLGTITDYDARTGSDGTTYHNDLDQLAVTWTASAGSFKDEISTGTSVVWIAPPTAQNDITIAVTIADRPHGPEREKYQGRQESFDIDYEVTVSVLGADDVGLVLSLPDGKYVGCGKDQNAIRLHATVTPSRVDASGWSWAWARKSGGWNWGVCPS